VEWTLLLCGAFFAGLIDAVVGGGGLIQLPLLLSVFPLTPIPILFGTNKISSIGGTASAAWQYSRKVKIPYQIAIPASVAALMGAFLGAATVSVLPTQALKPAVIILLLVVGLYTGLKPEFGKVSQSSIVAPARRMVSALLGLGLGFYDGFFGPGTGSFLIFGFVRLFGMDMLHASASAKLVNFSTNFAALLFFIAHDGLLWQVGIAMAAANILGSQLGARLAVRHGNGFVRYFLLCVVMVLVVKLCWDMFRY
jgi:uncharacterized membrane protein YfcA